MKCRRCHFYSRRLLVADFYSRFVMVRIQGGLHHKPRACCRVGDEIDNHLITCQRATTPVLGDKTEKTVFDLVPFAGAWRKMADFQTESRLVRQFLERYLPQPAAAAVASASISGNHEFGCPLESLGSHLFPPSPHAGDGPELLD